MTKSRALIPDRARINRDPEGTFIYYAKMAARNEASGNHSAAEALWLKAMRVAVKPVNREWADRRASMCKQLATKWKFTSRRCISTAGCGIVTAQAISHQQHQATIHRQLQVTPSNRAK